MVSFSKRNWKPIVPKWKPITEFNNKHKHTELAKLLSEINRNKKEKERKYLQFLFDSLQNQLNNIHKKKITY